MCFSCPLQVVGYKRFILFPGSETAHMYNGNCEAGAILPYILFLCTSLDAFILSGMQREMPVPWTRLLPGRISVL
jgi:hypothetical protein